MTQEEKHALIAERLEGFIPPPPGAKFDIWWKERIIGSDATRAAFLRPPNYSDDLNLCARVQAKIAGDLVLSGRYLTLLTEAMPPESFMPREPYSFATRWWVLSAPATARVDAIVALITQSEAR